MLIPTENKVLILADNSADKTDSGLIIPDDSKEKPMLGTVISVGQDCRQLKAGDRVIFPSMYGSKVTIEGKEHSIMKEGDVFAQKVAEDNYLIEGIVNKMCPADRKIRQYYLEKDISTVCSEFAIYAIYINKGHPERDLENDSLEPLKKLFKSFANIIEK